MTQRIARVEGHGSRWRYRWRQCTPFSLQVIPGYPDLFAGFINLSHNNFRQTKGEEARICYGLPPRACLGSPYRCGMVHHSIRYANRTAGARLAEYSPRQAYVDLGSLRGSGKALAAFLVLR